MKNKLLQNKFTPIIILTLVFIFASVWVKHNADSKLENANSSWEGILKNEMSGISSGAEKKFSEKESALLSYSAEIKKLISDSAQKSPGSGVIVSLLAKNFHDNICIEIFDKDTQLIAWKKDSPIQESELRELKYSKGEIFILQSPLVIYLAVYDKIILNGTSYLVFTAIPFQTKYSGSSSPESDNFVSSIEEEFKSDSKVFYDSVSVIKDGRYFNIRLTNNYNRTIASLYLTKPAPIHYSQMIVKYSENIQSHVYLIYYLLLMLLVYRIIKVKANSFGQGVLYIVFLVTLRLVMFYTNIPLKYFPTELTNPDYFSSKFGNGIVKSPAEFLVTSLMTFMALVYIYKKSADILKEKSLTAGSLHAYIRNALVLLIFISALLMTRGFAASVKSIIFDSSLMFFNEPSLLPSIPHAGMSAGIFLLGISFFLLLILLMKVIVFLLKSSVILSKRKFLVWAVIFISWGYLFITYQNSSLLSVWQYAVIIALALLAFLITYKIKLSTSQLILSIGFLSSVCIVMLMTIFNSARELESLKVSAAELQRPKPEFTQFILTDILTDAQSSEDIANAFKNNTETLCAEAFLLWRRSSLVSESIPAYIGFVDLSGNVKGEFEAGKDKPEGLIASAVGESRGELVISAIETKDNEISEIVGITPILSNDTLIGYCFAAVSLLETMPSNFASSPMFSGKKTNNGNLPLDNLGVIKIRDGKVVYSSGDLSHIEEFKNLITSAVYDEAGEAWFRYSTGQDNYVIFAQKYSKDNSVEIACTSLKEREIEWSFFNFFKLFIVHALIILLTYVIFGIAGLIKSRKITITFRTQLLGSFLFVSVIPILALAFYNHYNIEDKSTRSIRSSLSNQLMIVEQRLKFKLASDIPIQQAFEECGKEVGISFSVFSANKLIYSSRWNLYQAGVIPDRLPLMADMNLNYSGNKEFFASETNEFFNLFTYYREVTLRSPSPYILSVNNTFNYVAGSFSAVENDVFLFGIYSFAIFFLIGLTTFLSERIARPIKLLTSATKSVAKGDLSISVQNKAHGDVKELIDGFNTMTSELNRRQSELAVLEREVAWKDFARQVAHEIKNPLTPMKLMVQQLIASYKEKPQNLDTIFSKVTSTVLNQIEMLNNIASEFSSFARMPRPNYSHLDLINIISTTITLFANDDVKVNYDYGNISKAIVNGDSEQLQRVFINLVRNAIESSASEIELRLIEDSNAFLIFVANNGNAILTGLEEKIFENNYTSKKDGMGLGLSMSRRIIESAGGTIILKESTTEKTTFLITYPRVK